jgi:acetyltransferase-like isoleucine patch superfamily enzyme
MLLKQILNFLLQIKYKYLLNNAIVRVENGAFCKIGHNVRIINSRIFVAKDSILEMDENVFIKNTNLFIIGKVYIAKNSIIEKGYQLANIKLNIDGNLFIDNNSRLRCDIRIRFGGNLHIGCFTNINEETEIRVDDFISIGNYNQISYKCIIWDTNTHNIYHDEKRRELSEKYYPNLGYEYEKPKTKPVFIGNDCWIGREVAILKGVKINDSCVIGFRTMLSNCEIEKNKVVVPKIEYTYMERENNKNFI